VLLESIVLMKGFFISRIMFLIKWLLYRLPDNTDFGYISSMIKERRNSFLYCGKLGKFNWEVFRKLMNLQCSWTSTI
jgi:hypothetical protein